MVTWLLASVLAQPLMIMIGSMTGCLLWGHRSFCHPSSTIILEWVDGSLSCVSLLLQGFILPDNTSCGVRRGSDTCSTVNRACIIEN